MAEFNNASVNVQRNVNLLQNHFRTAVRKTNVKSRVEFRNNNLEQTNLSPQDLSAFASRISVQANTNKSPQDRFIEIYA